MPRPGKPQWQRSSALAALTAVALANYDPVRFLAADHYGGFVVGIVVVITGIRVARDASLELVDTMPSSELKSEILRTTKCVAEVKGIDKSPRLTPSQDTYVRS